MFLGFLLIRFEAAGVALGKMEHRLESKARYVALIIFSALTALGSGCGDGFSNRGGGALGSALASHVGDHLGGPVVELQVYTSCEGMDSKNPDTRCAGVRSAEIEVFFDGDSLIFDFSNAPKNGTISENGFEGYVLMMMEDSRLPALLDASLDTEVSNVDPERIQIEIDDASVAVNFQGLDYDDTTLVKVDLAFDGAGDPVRGRDANPQGLLRAC